MSMLEWYKRLNTAHQRRAYALAWYLCRSEEVAVRRIIPSAVEIAYKNVRLQDRRMYESSTSYKIMLSDAQLLQIGVLEAATREAAAPEIGTWLPYVARLALCTLPMNSFYVAVGFGRFLTNGPNQAVVDLHDFLEPGGPANRDKRAVRAAMKRITEQMSEWFPGLALTEISKQPGDARYDALAVVVPWGSDHLPDTEEAFSALQGARLQTMTQGNNAPPGRWRGRRRWRTAENAKAAVEVTRAHVCIDQQHCLEQVKEWGGISAQSFAQWRIPSPPGPGMHGNFNAGPWNPPGGSDWDQINGDIMREINWRQTQERRRSPRLGATLEVRVDGRVQATIAPAERDDVTITLPASARYVEIQDPVGQVLIATCHLMDPHDLPPEGWQRAVRLPDGGRLQLTFAADPAPEMEEASLRMTVRRLPASSILRALRAGVERVRARVPPATPGGECMPPRWPPIRSRWSPGWVTGAVMGLPLLAMGIILTLWLSTSQARPPVTWAVGVSHEELLGLKDVKDGVEKRLGATIDLQPIDSDKLVAALDYMAATKTMPDVISADNNTLGILAQKGLVQELSPYLRDAALPRDSLFQRLQEKHRIDGRDYSVPFHPNVKLMYYNQAMLNHAGYYQPPTTWEELDEFARKLASEGLGRVAIQAHPGKAAAVTVFEWVTSMQGDPRTLADPGAREAFKRLWNLAPYLDPESDKIKFDEANHVLVTDRVAVVDNWTYGIKVVMGDYGKKNIKVTPGLRGSVHVLGGDVLAIPTGLPKEREERAIKLIEQLVAKETQRALAEHLFWAPVREDVYTELSARQGLKKEYFEVIREGLRTTVMRPITPNWGVVQDILSEALQDVLKQGRTQGTPATDAQIDALLRPYIARLQAIPPDTYTRCDLVAQKTAGDKPCEALIHSPEKTPAIGDLARALQIPPATMAIINGRGEFDAVSPEGMRFLLVPDKKGE